MSEKIENIPRIWKFNGDNKTLRRVDLAYPEWRTIDNLLPSIKIEDNVEDYVSVSIKTFNSTIDIAVYDCENVEDLKKDLEKQYPVEYDDVICEIHNLKFHIEQCSKVAEYFKKRVKFFEEIVGEQPFETTNKWILSDRLYELGYDVDI